MSVLITVFLLMFSGAIFAADQVLCDEITNDPLGRGYSTMTAAQKAEDINTAYRDHFLDRVEGSALFEGIEAADWVGLSESQRTLVLQILSLGSINPQGNARTILISIFGGGSQTIANMASIATQKITRAQDLGIGPVNTGSIQKACG